jgi:hypothetical protein
MGIVPIAGTIAEMTVMTAIAAIVAAGNFSLKIILSAIPPNPTKGEISISVISPTQVRVEERQDFGPEKSFDREFLFDLDKLGYPPEILRLYRHRDKFGVFCEIEYYRNIFIGDRKKGEIRDNPVIFITFPGDTPGTKDFGIFTFSENIETNGHEVEIVSDDGEGLLSIPRIFPKMKRFSADSFLMGSLRRLLRLDSLAINTSKLHLLGKVVDRLVKKLDVDVSDLPEYARLIESDTIGVHLLDFDSGDEVRQIPQQRRAGNRTALRTRDAQGLRQARQKVRRPLAQSRLTENRERPAFGPGS